MCEGGGSAGLPTLVLITPCAEPSHHILVGLSLPVVGGGERAKPQYGERVSEYRPHVHPLSFFSPSSLFLFQLLYAGLVGTDGVDLGAEHHRGEDEEEEALKAQEYEEDDCCWRREGTALRPIIFKAVEEMEDHHDQRVERSECNVHCEKHKVLLVVLSNTVVDPGTVVVHLPYAAFANTAVVCSVRLDAAALGTFVDHLSWFQLKAFYVFLSGVSFWHGPRVSAHGPEVRGEGKEGQSVEQSPVHNTVHQVLGGQQHHKQHHKLSVKDQQPGDDGTHNAAGIPDEPHGRGRGGSDDVFGDGDALFLL